MIRRRRLLQTFAHVGAIFALTWSTVHTLHAAAAPAPTPAEHPVPAAPPAPAQAEREHTPAPAPETRKAPDSPTAHSPAVDKPADAHASASAPAYATPPVEAKNDAAKGSPASAKPPAPAAPHHPAPAAAASPPATKPGAPAAHGAAAKPMPDEILSTLKIGFTAVERRDYDGAEMAFRQVIAAPRAATREVKSALYALAQLHRRKGEFTKAAAIYESYLKDYAGDERTPDVLLELGRTLRSLGAHKLAIIRFYNVLNSTLKLPGEGFDRYQQLAKTAQFEIAETHFLSGDFAAANKFYTRLRLLDLAPIDRARAHFKAGYALRLQGSLEPAVTTLRSFVEQWPDDENIPEARYLLAVTLRELKRSQDAFNATLELLRTEKSRIEIDPKRWAYWQRKTGNQLANDFYENGDIASARSIYLSLMELATEPLWRLPLTYQLGLCDERLGATDQARAHYQTIIDAIGAKPPPELAELATMAKWRIEHMGWRDRVSKQLASHFDTKVAKTTPAPPSTPAGPSPTKTASNP